MADSSPQRMILVGADDPLPSDHFWFDGEGFSVYTAKQPKSTWREHAHDCVQVTVGLEPAHMLAEWRSDARLRKSRELIGNAVTVIPAKVPHRTLWQRRAALIHVYIREELLQKIAKECLNRSSFELNRHIWCEISYWRSSHVRFTSNRKQGRLIQWLWSPR